MKINYKLALLILVDLVFLFYGVTTISISAKEAHIYYEGRGFLHQLVHLGTAVFGQNDFGLRIPFIIFHLLGVLLLYRVSGYYQKDENERVFTIALFMFLPGVLSSSLIVNSSSVTIFFTIFFIYLFEEQKKTRFHYILLFLLLFVDSSYEVLYLGVFAYAVFKRYKKLAIYTSILFLISLYIYGFDSGGKPKGYFLDTLALYSLVFSPILFLYYFYTMYRIVFKWQKTMLWFISFTGFMLSIVLSFRQRIPLSEFAPYAVIALPLVVDYFFRSVKVRLKIFRKPYYVALGVTVFFLIVNFSLTYFNKVLYLFLENPNKHFAQKFHIAKDLAKELKKQNIDYISCDDKSMCLRLKFYKIHLGNQYLLSERKNSNNCKKVTISYTNKPIKSYCVSNLHTFTLK